jgi:septal ring factor EnvC (AmiA/AmiB activator)
MIAIKKEQLNKIENEFDSLNEQLEIAYNKVDECIRQIEDIQYNDLDGLNDIEKQEVFEMGIMLIEKFDTLYDIGTDHYEDALIDDEEIEEKD